MITLFTIPIALISIFLYLALTFFGNSTLVWITGSALGLIFSIWLFKKVSLKVRPLKLTLLNILLIAVACGFVLAKALVVSPLVITQKSGSFEHLQIAGVGDYYKHTLVVTILAKDGIPPHNPYFPSAKFSYYYGYYLIPALLTKVFGLFPNISFYIFVVATDLLTFAILITFLNEYLKTYWGKLIALMLFITASGVDIFPQIMTEFTPLAKFIDSNIFAGSDRFQLINNYKSFIYVPQHVLAAIFALILIHLLFKGKINSILLGSLYAFIAMCSIFVFATLSFWLLLVFIFYPAKRFQLIKLGFIFMLLSLPYFIYLSSGRQNILYVYQMDPYHLFKITNLQLNYQLNSIVTFLLKYGPVLFFLPFLLLLSRLKPIQKISLLLAILAPLAVTWFIRSPRYDDFSLRTSIPIQFGLPILFLNLTERLETKLGKGLLIMLSLVTISAGILGLYLEYSRHWKERLILPPKDSELLIKLRKSSLNQRLAALERDRWVELIPSLSFRSVLNPFLYDTFDYFPPDRGLEHSRYESLALQLFIDEDTGKDINDLVRQKNNQLSRLAEFFNSNEADLLVVSNQLWFKKDINPWWQIFKQLQVSSTALTPHFTAFNYQQLRQKISNNRLGISQIGLIEREVKDRKFNLPTGLWYIAGCVPRGTRQPLKLELEDYLLLFNQELGPQNKLCAGKIFYLNQSEDLLLTTTSNTNQVFALPVNVIPK